MTDTYVIQVNEPEYALDALMFVLAIDAEKMFEDVRKGCVCFCYKSTEAFLNNDRTTW